MGVRSLAGLGSLAGLLLLAGPVAAQSDVVAIRAGRIYTMTGKPIEQGVILIRNGRIVAVGKDVKVPAGTRVIDASSKVIIPGLIAANTTLAQEVDAEEAVTPHVRAVDSFDFVRDYKRLLEGGVTSVYVGTGDRRLVTGRGGVVKLAGANAAARTLRPEADVRVVLGEPSKGAPPLFRPPIPPTTENPILPAQRQQGASLASQVSVVRQLLLDARSLGDKARTGRGVARLAPLSQVAGGKSTLRVRAGRAAEIGSALNLARQQGVPLILEGATEGYRTAKQIASAGAAVVVQSPARIGASLASDLTRASAVGRPSLTNVSTLLNAGVRVCLAPSDDADLPNLLLLAASEVGRGVSPDAALRMVTITPAEVLGLAHRVGTIAPGRDADLVILDGEPLDSRTRVAATLINGRTVYQRPGERDRIERGLIAIKAGRILTATQGEITDGVIVIRGGRIIEVNRTGLVPAGATVINASHSVVMPGMIDAHTHLGLHAEADPAPLDFPSATTGSASGRTNLLNALTPGDPAFGEVLASGVTTVLIAPPTSGQVCGRAALLKTAECSTHGVLCADRIVREVAAVCFNMQGGTQRLAQPWTFRDLLQRAKDYHQRRAKYEQDLKDWERDRREAESKKTTVPREPTEVPLDEDLAPLAALFRGQVPALVHANRADEITNALTIFADESEIPLILVDATDSFRMTDQIRKRGATVALGPDVTHMDKGREVNSAQELTRAGVPTLFQSSATSGVQMLRLNAANAVRNGMDPADALRAVTINPARSLKVDDRLGSIEPGKDADLVILSGDPWDVTSRVQKVLVNGKVMYDGK
jgi:imidazolonepropionase-like amidohydrolase